MKFIGKADQIQIILVGLLAIYGNDAKMADVERKHGEKK